MQDVVVVMVSVVLPLAAIVAVGCLGYQLGRRAEQRDRQWERDTAEWEEWKDRVFGEPPPRLVLMDDSREAYFERKRSGGK